MTRAVTKTLLAATILVAAHGFAICEEAASRIVKLVVGAPAGGGGFALQRFPGRSAP